jgi:hypothetical protein
VSKLFLTSQCLSTSSTLAFQSSKDGERIVIGTVSTAVLERPRPFDSPYTGTSLRFLCPGQ